MLFLAAFLIVCGYAYADEFDFTGRGVTVTASESITDGNLSIPEAKVDISGLPPFHRVAMTLKPTPESNIRVEVWLPHEWNGRFLGTGNGGGGGNINYWALETGLKRGFAVANTDLGTSPSAVEAAGYPEKWKDFGYRATHEMTVAAKRAIEEFYGRPPLYSYFTGCSTGGQQALMEAQRFPEDYDGIIAGAPANNRTHLHTGFLWNHRATNREPGLHFTQRQIEGIVNAVVRGNAGSDGGAPDDDFLTDPRMAAIDYRRLDTLLSPAQIEVLKELYAGPVNPRTGERIYTPYPPGSEIDGLGIVYQQENSVIADQFYPFFWAFGSDFDWRRFDFDADLAKVDSLLAPILNANNPDLGEFKSRGGKLLMYSGTCDAIVPMQDAINYYERVIEKEGNLRKTQTFFRYFIVPGMKHCGGGPGPCDFGQSLALHSPMSPENDILTALVEWVEKGRAPERFIATGWADGKVKLRRPLFPYPLFPEYRGGDPSRPESFRPRKHRKAHTPSPAEKYLN